LGPVQADCIIFSKNLAFADQSQSERLHATCALLASRRFQYPDRLANSLQSFVQIAPGALGQSYNDQGSAGLRRPIRRAGYTDRAPAFVSFLCLNQCSFSFAVEPSSFSGCRLGSLLLAGE
jgi:hypothetical protein